MASFEEIKDVERFITVKDAPSFYGFYRAYELHKGDVLYCNHEFMKEFRCYNDLLLLQEVNLNGIAARVVKVIKNKKYPNKKWWQFWLKQEEYVTGYHLEII